MEIAKSKNVKFWSVVNKEQSIFTKKETSLGCVSMLWLQLQNVTNESLEPQELTVWVLEAIIWK